MLKRPIPAIFLFLLLCLVTTGSAGADVTLTVLQTTDIHGSPGLPRLCAIIRQQRAADPDLILIDCGDLIQGSFEATVDQGGSAADLFLQNGYDVYVPGNHDFDFGTKRFLRHLTQMEKIFTAANLHIAGHQTVPYRIIQRKGLRIAVIGITAPYLDHWTGLARLPGITTGKITDTLLRIMPQVRREKPHIIVLALHLGEYTSRRLTRTGETGHLSHLTTQFPEIDLILGGHSHTTVPGKALPPSTWFVQAPPHAEGLAKIRISYDTATQQLINIQSEILFADETAAAPGPDLPHSWQKNLHRADTAEKQIIAPGLPDNVPLAEICAKAMIHAAKTDCAFFGTSQKYVRGDRPLTAGQLYRLLPYENLITVLTLTPRQIRQITDEQQTFQQSRHQSRLTRYGQEITSGMYTVAFSSYDVSGAGGRFPVLKSIADSGTVRRKDLELNIRECTANYIKEKYSAGK